VYYGTVGLAILAGAARSVVTNGSAPGYVDRGGAVQPMRGTRLAVAECPAPLREFVAV